MGQWEEEAQETGRLHGLAALSHGPGAQHLTSRLTVERELGKRGNAERLSIAPPSTPTSRETLALLEWVSGGRERTSRADDHDDRRAAARADWRHRTRPRGPRAAPPATPAPGRLQAGDPGGVRAARQGRQGRAAAPRGPVHLTDQRV